MLYNAATGEKLWEADLGWRSFNVLVTYELDGKQYVSLLARGAPATRVFTFVLDGAEPMPPARLRRDAAEEVAAHQRARPRAIESAGAP